jgi:hypothetical protein
MAINKSDITFIGPYKPTYDISTTNFKSGAIWDGTIRIGTTKNLKFINMGFKDSAGGDPFMCGGISTNERNLYMSGCVFAGTHTNAHNVEIIGRNVELNNCSSFNGGHNFAFKTYNLNLNNIYSYNGSYNGIILKGSERIGDFLYANLSNIVIDGPSNTNTAMGLHINGYSPESKTQHIKINNLKTHNVNMAIYINPYVDSIVRDIIVCKVVSYDSYQVHGDFLMQANATNITFLNCRSYNSAGKSFVNYGSKKVKLLQCYSTKDDGNRTSGAFDVKQINGKF